MFESQVSCDTEPPTEGLMSLSRCHGGGSPDTWRGSCFFRVLLGFPGLLGVAFASLHPKQPRIWCVGVCFVLLFEMKKVDGKRGVVFIMSHIRRLISDVLIGWPADLEANAGIC